MKEEEVSDGDLWRGLADAGEAIAGLAKLYVVISDDVNLFDGAQAKQARHLLGEHWKLIDRLKESIEGHLFEIENRWMNEDAALDEPSQ